MELSAAAREQLELMADNQVIMEVNQDGGKSYVAHSRSNPLTGDWLGFVAQEVFKELLTAGYIEPIKRLAQDLPGPPRSDRSMHLEHVIYDLTPEGQEVAQGGGGQE